MRTVITAILALAFYPLAYCQLYSIQEINTDLEFLTSNIKTYNPALYRFNPEFDKKVDALRKEIHDDMPALEYFQLMSRVVALSNEGHMDFGDWNDTIHNGFIDGRYKYMPFSVKIIDDRIYVWKNYSNENRLKQGDEIFSINGRSASSILEKIKMHRSSDGHINTYLDHTLSSSFPWMYYLYVEQTPNFHINYVRLHPQMEGSTLVKALSRKQMQENYKAYFPKEVKKGPPTNDVYELDINSEQQYAYLKLKSFNRQKLEDNDIKAKKFYKKIFTSLKEQGIRKLIVDLRDNNVGEMKWLLKCFHTS